MLQYLAVDVNSSYQNTNSTGNGTTPSSRNTQGSSSSTQNTGQTQAMPTTAQGTSQANTTPNYTFYAIVVLGVLILAALIVIIKKLGKR